MDHEARCLVCDKSAQEIPLIALHYQEKQYWICPQHFPIPFTNLATWWENCLGQRS